MTAAWTEKYLPVIFMVILMASFAIVTLWNKDVLAKGMSPRIFVFYRQVVATIITCPLAYIFRQKSNVSRMDLKTFLLIFSTAFVGVALYQNLNIEGLKYVGASAIASMFNLVPAITFIMAAIIGLEIINFKKLSTIAKLVGTVVCVGGAMSITLVKGPKLLNCNLVLEANFLTLHSQESPDWLLGCIITLSSFCFYALYLILQVPITRRYSDHATLSAWMCLLSMVQNCVIAFLLERDFESWTVRSRNELFCVLFTGIFGSSFQYFIQPWCISRKGPLFSAMFNPLGTVLTTFLAILFVHEEVFIGTVLGAVLVIIGLYVVLWGKAEEMKQKVGVEPSNIPPGITTKDSESRDVDLEQPLLKDSTP